jgi:hypothetical protein
MKLILTEFRWKYLFEPYYVHSFVKGHSGTDIGPIKGNPWLKLDCNLIHNAILIITMQQMIP